ncbi:hypothetical protein Lal_00041262 [Lupinus albus]|uniref:Uncharacterized protein n=1 Tax=Lupinus albus TaxID=3870 RepID=A0A6A4P5Z3_LUPAL|nr:hypothetical protein Lalb_Chr18g0060481 [Lupinus albus]KAF1890501.1 hypothetical protein Lal_00041262 [Lupinus albus]
MASRKLLFTYLLLVVALSSMNLSLGARNILERTSSAYIPTIPTLPNPTRFPPLPPMGVNVPPLPTIPTRPLLPPTSFPSIPITFPFISPPSTSTP